MQEENDMDANKNSRYINAILISSYLREKKSYRMSGYIPNTKQQFIVIIFCTNSINSNFEYSIIKRFALSTPLQNIFG